MRELIQEVLQQTAGEPLRFAAEFVQFLLLVVLIRVLLLRTAAPALKKRRERIADEVKKADQADAVYDAARQQAAALVAEAHAEARRTIEAARAAAQDERQAGLERAEQEAKAILLQARQAIEAEKGKVTTEAADELVTLITLVSRRFIEESLSDSERRTVTQKLILASLKELEGSASRT